MLQYFAASGLFQPAARSARPGCVGDGLSSRIGTADSAAPGGLPMSLIAAPANASAARSPTRQIVLLSSCFGSTRTSAGWTEFDRTDQTLS